MVDFPLPVGAGVLSNFTRAGIPKASVLPLFANHISKLKSTLGRRVATRFAKDIPASLSDTHDIASIKSRRPGACLNGTWLLKSGKRSLQFRRDVQL